MTMSLLDAALAFALTMAALATVVTIVMEIVIVSFGLKAKGQVKLVKKLLGEHVEKRFGKTDGYNQWNAVVAILGNSLSPGTFPAEGAETNTFSLYGRGGGVYNKVSLEHLLRRVVEIDGLDAVSQMPAQLRANLKTIALKYGEWCSATSVEFARRSRFWSLVIGILLALILNVDGLRLFEAYKSNPQMAEKVIEQMDPILEQAREAQKSLDEKLAAAGQGETSPEQLEKAVTEFKAQLGIVSKIVKEHDLPIGNAYYPHCLWLKDSVDEGGTASADPLCGSVEVGQKEKWGNRVGWFLRIVITGLLIGLGAPFWYDVAKRLGQVRQAFGAKGSAAERHKGSDGDESPEAKDKLITAVVADALAGARTTRIFID